MSFRTLSKSATGAQRHREEEGRKKFVRGRVECFL
jgi:hypothetical protein